MKNYKNEIMGLTEIFFGIFFGFLLVSFSFKYL